MKNKRGFTLIELLAVIIILGVLMLIAIPSVTEYISNSRKKVYITTAKEYIGAIAIKVNNLDLPISDPNTTYYVPIDNINLEKGGKSPYGEWEEAYVVVTFDGTKYYYYWTSIDEKGNAILLTDKDKLTSDSITTSVEDIETNVGVGNRDSIVVFNPDGTTQPSKSPETLIEEGSSIAEGTTVIPRPVITLNGEQSIEVPYGSTYTDLGATASDDEDGDITASIVVTNNVNTNTLGEQYVRYNVTNSNGVTAIEVVRTITIVSTANQGYIASEGINAPLLLSGMTAVKWNGATSTWDTVASPNNDTSWYDYSNKQWANAKTTDGSMWVWIPRYAYQIATGYHTSTAGTINIKFLKNDTNTADDSTQIYEDSLSNTHFVVHPAFTFGTEKLTGMWVAKFEMSGTVDSLDSKPGASSIRNTQIGAMFIASRNMETNNKYGWSLASGLNTTTGVFSTDTNNIDAHIMRNSEWGVVAYLSQSTYGKNAEITINNSSNYYTGGGAGDAYITNVDQSTTGNIYGIYDISGGSTEYVMGNFNNIPDASGLTPSSINSKYIDIYTAYNSTKYGDAIYETSTSTSGNTAWYGDASYVINGTFPWLERGGRYNDGTLAGAFLISYAHGEGNNYDSWRTVLVEGTGL